MSHDAPDLSLNLFQEIEQNNYFILILFSTDFYSQHSFFNADISLVVVNPALLQVAGLLPVAHGTRHHRGRHGATPI